MADQEMIQEKIGEALGLEMAAQKTVEELDSRGLLESEHVKKLAKMREEAKYSRGRNATIGQRTGRQ